MFSATLHSESIRHLADQICRSPIWVDLKGRDYVPSTVQQVNCFVDVTDPAQSSLYSVQRPSFTDGVHPAATLPHRLSTPEEKSEATKRAKLQLMVALLNQYKMDRVIVFCRTNVDCNNLEAYLRALDQR